MKIYSFLFFSLIISCSSENGPDKTIENTASAKPKNYVSYFTGKQNDVVKSTTGGICLMGGATENDEAMKWFLSRANGGDILVLRTSGNNGYNSYFYTELGVTVNSVETIVFSNSKANSDPYIIDKINKAEAIWFAGGDQYEYVSYWRESPVATAIKNAISKRNIVVGGTSAGMAIQGGYYFTAKNGTVTSSEALQNPFNSKITVDKDSFLDNTILKNVITDTHYDNPDRKGRHVVFMARIVTDYAMPVYGIACDEYTSVCINELGVAKVYGGYPSKDDNAYFIKLNPEITNNKPEVCVVGSPLEWNKAKEALKVYQIKGTSSADNSFNLNNWSEGTGGIWKTWYVENGILID